MTEKIRKQIYWKIFNFYFSEEPPTLFINARNIGSQTRKDKDFFLIFLKA